MKILSNQMQRITVIIILVFVLRAFYCFGTDEELEKAINKVKGKSKIELLNKAARNAIDQGAYDVATGYLSRSEKLLEKYSDQKLKAEWLFLNGEIFYYKDENEQAIEIYRKSALLCKEIDFKDIFCQSIYKIGLTYYYLRDYDMAISYLDSGLIISEKYGFDNLIGKSYEALARVNRDMNEPDKAIEFIDEAIKIYEKEDDVGGLAKAYNSLGWVYFNLGENQRAIFYYSQSLQFQKELNNKLEIAVVSGNIGNVYWKLGNFEKAIEYQQEALKYFEGIDHKAGIANSLNNIGNCYASLVTENQSIENIKNLQNALTYYERALNYRKELADSFQISSSYWNISNIKTGIINEKFMQLYGDSWSDTICNLYNKDTLLEIYKEPILLYKEALLIKEKIKDLNGKGSIYHNLGKIYNQIGLYHDAFKYLAEGLDISRQIRDKYLESNILFDIGTMYKNKKQFNLANKYFFESLEINRENDYKYLLKHNYTAISEVFEKLKNIPEAFHYYKLYTQVKDSIVNEEKYKQIAELETRYETEKKEKEIQLLNKDNELQRNRVKQARLVIYFISAGGIIIIFFLFIVYKQYLDKRKANLKLEAQNNLIRKQKQDITDSITYASRIQGALLPPEELLDQLLKEYFILFLPKDIVSGDFYWVNEYNGKVITAAVDCTGHGVPGAFMSMLGIAYLNEIVNKRADLHANEILIELRNHIIKSLRQTQTIETGKDGMDVSLTIIDRENLTAEYAGAFNPLIICRNGEIIEYKADRMPVGMHFKYEIPFQNHLIKLQKNDMLYAFSDGFQDQFGGEDKRKFMFKRLKEMLLEIHKNPIEEQKEILLTTHEMWKGANPQLDDIILFGIRI